MKLLEIYKEKNNDAAWKNRFFSLAKGNAGSVYKYINTNFRTQKSFISQFTSFEGVESIDRADWRVQDGNKQEVDKQRVVKLLEARLFQEFKNGGLEYRKTEKGRSYRKYIDKKFGESERWVINYLYLLDGNYQNEKNHIIERTREILGLFHMLGLTASDVLPSYFKEFFGAEDKKGIINKDLFYIMSFFADPDFLEIYFKSAESDKQELYEYISQNLQKENDLCCISQKYKTGGNYSYSMVLDEVRVFQMTYFLLNSRGGSQKFNFEGLLDECKEIFDFDSEEVVRYTREESEVFDLIFSNVFEVEDEDDVDEVAVGEDIDEKGPLPYIDTTTKSGQRKVRKIFAAKKERVNELADYRCSLESSRSCDNHYFTSKITGKNYVEVHHLIPREYSNRFNNSIEVFPNYVTLCPGCHQLMHKAVDRERKDHLKRLLSERRDRMIALGLCVEVKDLLEFYGIEI